MKDVLDLWLRFHRGNAKKLGFEHKGTPKATSSGPVQIHKSRETANKQERRYCPNACPAVEKH